MTEITEAVATLIGARALLQTSGWCQEVSRSGSAHCAVAAVQAADTPLSSLTLWPWSTNSRIALEALAETRHDKSRPTTSTIDDLVFYNDYILTSEAEALAWFDRAIEYLTPAEGVEQDDLALALA